MHARLAIAIGLFGTFTSGTAFAGSFMHQQCRSNKGNETFACPPYVDECAITAYDNFKQQARMRKATLDIDSIRVESVDDHVLKPSKYVWFTATAALADGSEVRLTTLTQKTFGYLNDCF